MTLESQAVPSQQHPGEIEIAPELADPEGTDWILDRPRPRPQRGSAGRGTARPESARGRTSVDFPHWEGSPYSDDLHNSFLDILLSRRAGRSRGRRPSHNLVGWPDKPFRTSDPAPDVPPAHRPENPLLGSIFASGYGDVPTTQANALRYLRPPPEQVDRGTSPGDPERNRLLVDTHHLSDAPIPEDQEAPPHGTGAPHGPPRGTTEPPSTPPRRGSRVGCFYFPPLRTPVRQRIAHAGPATAPEDMTMHRGDMRAPMAGPPPPGARHPPGVEEVTSQFLGFVTKCCGGVWACPCNSVAFCCDKGKCPERCGQAYTRACGESGAAWCRQKCPDICQPEECAGICRGCAGRSRYCEAAVAHPENRACVTCVSGWCCLATTMTCTQVLAPLIIRLLATHGMWLR